MGEFWHYYGPQAADVARKAVCDSIDTMVAALSEDAREAFHARFADPIAKLAKVASWRDLPTDKLHGLHDLCSRTPPASIEA